MQGCARHRPHGSRNALEFGGCLVHRDPGAEAGSILTSRSRFSTVGATLLPSRIFSDGLAGRLNRELGSTLVDLLAQNGGKRLATVGRDLVHRGPVISLNADLRSSRSSISAGRLLVDLDSLRAEVARGAADEARSGAVEGLDLVEHELLVWRERARL